MHTTMSRRRLLQAAAATATVAAVPFAASADFAGGTTNAPSAPTGPVSGFRIHTRDAVVQSLAIDSATQQATVVFTAAVSDVDLVPGAKARLVSGDDDQ